MLQWTKALEAVVGSTMPASLASWSPVALITELLNIIFINREKIYVSKSLSLPFSVLMSGLFWLLAS